MSKERRSQPQKAQKGRKDTTEGYLLLSGASGADDARNNFVPSGRVRSLPLARCLPFFAGYPLTTISVPTGRESLLKPRRNKAFGAPASTSQVSGLPSEFLISIVIHV